MTEWLPIDAPIPGSLRPMRHRVPAPMPQEWDDAITACGETLLVAPLDVIYTHLPATPCPACEDLLDPAGAARRNAEAAALCRPSKEPL